MISFDIFRYILLINERLKNKNVLKNSPLQMTLQGVTLLHANVDTNNW